MTQDYSDLEGLRQYATPRQEEYIDAILKTGNASKAEKLLKTGSRVIMKSITRLRAKASLKGYSPKHDMNHTVPDPFNVKGVSTYYNKEGKPTGQWVKSDLDREKARELMLAWIHAQND